MNTVYQKRIDREPSSIRIGLIPIFSVMIGSMLVLFIPYIASMPLLPPLGLMMLIAWRLIRPGLWPIWIGFPLGLFDDIFSGQPFGSAAFLWSLVMIFIEIMDNRFLWRGFWQDWLIAAVSIMLALIGGLLINNIIADAGNLTILLPQIILSIFLYPLVLRIVAWLDRKRLTT
ncbi:rod shape-determining protein MreD [Sphingorhabdus sp. Alg239-R122]|uniref:rod shape-determining protein MreD n=1 Tax=Sphingorhabdus sp. Alg239-R122 TaxID=2305989 RepID=UPI0013DA8247|nr:rod shape-determining protein MreD [Sphingorhabdus sp. Alg239-R122]